MELAEAQTVRVDISHSAEFAVINQRLQLLERRVEAQDMADHEDPVIGLGCRNSALSVRHVQGYRLLNQNILAVLDRLDRVLCMKLRRQSHDDSIDIIALEQFLGLQEQAVLLAGKAFGP